jgi:hypothetical protein
MTFPRMDTPTEPGTQRPDARSHTVAGRYLASPIRAQTVDRGNDRLGIASLRVMLKVMGITLRNLSEFGTRRTDLDLVLVEG